MVASRENAEQGLGFILTDISRLARKEFDRRIRDLGLTRAQWLVLHHLTRLPGCTQSDLAERLQMEKITVSRHADRLVRAGWIARRDCSVDGRAYRLFVAPKAEPIIARLAAVAHEMRSEYLAGLAPGRRRALFADLEHIRSNLLRMDADAKRRLS